MFQGFSWLNLDEKGRNGFSTPKVDQNTATNILNPAEGLPGPQLGMISWIVLKQQWNLGRAICSSF